MLLSDDTPTPTPLIDTAAGSRSIAAALEQLAQGVIVTDAAGRITFVNDAAARLHGVARLDVSPEQYTETYDLLTVDGRPYPSTELPLARAVLRGETVLEARWRIRRPDGSEVYAVGSAQPVLSPAGERLGAVLTLRDDGPRVEAERELRASEERLRLAVAATGLGVFDWDLTTDLVTVNARFREMFGLPESNAVIGAAMMGGVVHPEDRAFVEARIAAALDPRSSGAYQFEHRAVTPAGEAWLLTFGQVFFAGEGDARRALRVIGNDLDVTARKHAEAEREHAHRQLQDQAAELETQAEELQAAAAELEEQLEDAERARAAARASEARYRSLFERIDEGFCVIELLFDVRGMAVDYRFVEANPAFAEQTGLASAVGRTARELVPGLEQHWVDTYARVATTGESTRFQQGSDAMGRWFDVFAFRTGRPAERRVALLFTDVTAVRVAARERERLHAEVSDANAELRRLAAGAQAAERRARFLADLGQALQPLAAPDDVMETTARLLGEQLGVDRCAYAEVEADEDTFTITGNYTRGETRSIVGRFTFRAFGAEVLRLMRANAAYVTDDAATDPRVTPPDRTAYEATQIRAVICVPLHKAGRFVAGMAVHQRAPRAWTPEEVELVVTVVQRCWEALERARALRRLTESEAALRATSAQLAERTAAAEAAQRVAEAANRVKTEFLSTMSHELRTPLNAIGGYAELLAMGVRGPVTDAQREDLERLRRANQHMLGLVNDVLNFARVEAGQVAYHLEPVSLGPLVRDLEALIRPQFAAKGLAYDHDGCGPETPDQPHTVRADPEKVRQILLNLLTNAAKFTDADGRVALECETDVAAGAVRIRVADTGIGIAPDQLARVFEPFVQVDRNRTLASQQGVGLGLAISRDLARGMGGDLTVESAVGVGSTFTVTLPSA